MSKPYLIAAVILLASLALSVPMYEAPERAPKTITIGQSDEDRRMELYERDVEEFGEEKARMMMRTREKGDSLFPQPLAPSR